MDILDQLRGYDGYRYLGVEVVVTLSSGETLRGTLYCVELRRSKTIIIRGFGSNKTSSLYLINVDAVKSVSAVGPLNESLDDIPRVSQHDLMGCIASLSHPDNDLMPKRA
ncbi:hypothetical protein BgAZ_100510 [Babesia gibsoni]|uniref:Uncharacterized protein n=1 Tax=Babesia gibsoni TaxID=33632 RepID=A0AAD8UR45_BABGI|nr:hypothetical protein BgAZ_100510 [Babesia gibsoni]